MPNLALHRINKFLSTIKLFYYTFPIESSYPKKQQGDIQTTCITNLTNRFTRTLTTPIFLIALCISSVLGFCQDIDNGLGPKEISGHLLKGSQLHMDGLVDEAFWLAIPPSGNFRMQEPKEGGAPTERTEIRIAFDDQNIYIGVICHDNDPSGIKAFQKKRDASLETDDHFRWILDTFMDKRRAYFFEINPLGLRGDGLISSGQGQTLNMDWDGIWNAWTYKGDFGWSAEIRIPFKSINFDPKGDCWGINFQRTIRRKNEVLLWTGHRRNQGLLRPQNAGILRGLHNPSQGIGLEFVPYGIAQNDKEYQETGESIRNKSADLGFDVNYNITPNLRASFTYNTDFAQTEVDD